MGISRGVRRLFGALVILLIGTVVAGCGALGNHSSTTTTVTAPAPSGQGGPTASGSGQTTPSAAGQTTQAATSSGQGAPSAQPAGNAVVLPFTGLTHPVDVIVGAGGGIDGAVFVTDSGNNRVVKLAGDSYAQSVLPISGLNAPGGLTFVNGENIAVADANSTRILWASAQRTPPTPPWQAVPGSTTEWVGPFTALQSPHGMSSMNGTIYVADSGNNRVMKYASGQNTAEVVTFTGLNNPNGVDVVNRGLADVYVVDSGNNRVVELGDGSNQPQTVLGFTGLSSPHGVAVDSDLNVFVADSGNDRVVRLSKDRSTQAVTQTILPFTGLKDPEGVFVDSVGNLYVVDTGNNRVLKLAKTFATQ
jgi:serine/threonine-protein kinase